MVDKRRRGRPPASAGPSTRDQILKAGREVFSELGYEGTTFKAIAERAGLTRPAVSHYFRNKELLFLALSESARDTVVTAGADRAGGAITLPDRLAAFLDSAMQVDSADPSFARFMAASVLDAFRHPQLREAAHGQLDHVRAFVRQALEAAVAEGEVRPDLDVPAVTEMLIAVLWGMGLYAGFVGTHEQLEHVVAQFVRLLTGDLW